MRTQISKFNLTEDQFRGINKKLRKGYIDGNYATLCFKCESCNEEFWGEWLLHNIHPHYNIREFNELNKDIWLDFEKLMAPVIQDFSYALAITNCPVCGKPLNSNSNNSRLSYPKSFETAIKNKSVADQYKHLRPYYNTKFHLKMCEEYYTIDKDLYLDSFKKGKTFKEIAENNVNQLKTKYDVSVPVSPEDSIVKNISENTELLIQYIESLMNLERNIVSLSDRLLLLYVANMEYQHKVNMNNFHQKDKLLRKLFSLKSAYEDKNREKSNIGPFNVDISDKITKTQPKKPTEPQKPILKKPGLFNKKTVLKENEDLTLKYNQELEQYNIDLNNYKKDDIEYNRYLDKLRQETVQSLVAKKNNELSQLQSEIDKLDNELKSLNNNSLVKLETSYAPLNKNNIILTEINEATALLENCYKCRNELYGYNIIYYKYRNLPALSTFHEYLLLGRCSMLSGANGVYNLYESELRANMIITQLSQVMHTIDIKLGDITNSLNNLNTQTTSLLSNMSDNLNTIAFNSAKTAYYSKLNAQLTDSLGFMLALK